MTHSTAMQSTPSISIRGFNFGARIMENFRIFASDISSSIQGIFVEPRPFIERARIQPDITLSTLFNIQRVRNLLNTAPSSSDNYVMYVEDRPAIGPNLHDVLVHDTHQHHHQRTEADNFLNNIHEVANEVVDESPNNNSNNATNHNNNNNDSNMEGNSAEPVQNILEERALIGVFHTYIPVIIILLIKGIYDHWASIFIFLGLVFTFNDTNNMLKREIAKQQNRSWMSFLMVICYIIGSIVYFNVDYEISIFSKNTQPLSISELLWSVVITDFVLKLFTIICKSCLTYLPLKLLALRKRGKYYLMVEATSQLYRCVAPIQPWLYYFYEAYQGPEKILGVVFCVLYTACKGRDLLPHVKLFCSAIRKLLQNVNFCDSPSKEQLIASGGICAICHEQYSIPVRLHCKHIFCETCVLTWLNRKSSCPLCRAVITDDPSYQDGHTTYFIQLY